VFLKNSKRFLFPHVSASLFWLCAYHGKLVCTRIGAAGINDYAVIGTVVMIPGFAGGFAVIKYPADFEFPLFRDKGGILENP
jgi:hypothetical protein